MGYSRLPQNLKSGRNKAVRSCVIISDKRTVILISETINAEYNPRKTKKNPANSGVNLFETYFRLIAEDISRSVDMFILPDNVAVCVDNGGMASATRCCSWVVPRV